MNKRVQKLVAMLLVFVLMFSSIGLETMAASETDQVTEEVSAEISDDQAAEDQTQDETVSEDQEDAGAEAAWENAEESAETDADVDAGDAADADANTDVENETDANATEAAAEDAEAESETESKLQYVYVDESTINIPETQNIVVAFTDESVSLDSVVLHYSSVSDGQSYEMEAATILDNTVLFTKEYVDGDPEDTYCLDSIVYQETDAEDEQEIDFSKEGIEAGYTVTYEEEVEQESTEEETPDVTVYAIDEDGNAVEESGDDGTIEETVQNALESTGDEDIVEESTEDTTGSQTGLLGKLLTSGIANMTLGADTISSITASSSSKTLATSSGNKVIVICAGHDSTHTGATGNGLNEEQLTFKVASYCKAELEKYSGVTVYLDRSSVACAYPGKDTSYCLNQRVKDAYKKGASVFVDIHFNSAVASAYGAEVYYPNKSYSSAIHKDGNALANNILEQLEALGLYNRGAKIKDCTDNEKDSSGNLADYYTSIGLSKEYGMTGIIVEHAFLTNASDASKLKSESFLKKLGVADATGIANTYGLTKGGNLTVSNKNDFKGTCTIKATGLGTDGYVKIYNTSASGTVKKYSISSGSGSFTFNISDLNGKRGTFNVTSYTSAGNVVKTTTFYVAKDVSTTLTVDNVDNADTKYKVTLKIAETPEEVTGVQFPTWTEEDGQDDIKWVKATKTSSGAWQATIKFSDYKKFGKYILHAYAILSDGTKTFLKATTFTATKPTLSVSTKNVSKTNGTFDVIITDVKSNSGVSKLEVPVWCASNQSDIKWYVATKQSDGSYKVTVKMANHKYNVGAYKIHTYITTGNGMKVFGGAASNVTMTLPKAKVTATDSKKTETSYALKVTNAGIYGTAKAVQFATWSVTNGQDDLKWYSGTNKGAGVWTATAAISNHKTAGTYNVHVYVTFSDGTKKFLGATTFTVTKPTLSVSTENVKKNNGTFDVIIKNVVSPSGVSKIEVPVWCASNQSDIKWYTATKQSDGSYKVTVKMANHKYNVGAYKIHTYITAKNGIKVFGGAASNVSMTLPKVRVTATDSAGTETSYTLRVKNVGLCGTVKSVQFATWSVTDGQDDLKWYTGTNKGSDIWAATASISNHKTAGTYNVHVYVTLSNGTKKFVGATTFEVSAPSISSVTTKKYDKTAGTFKVVVSGVESASGVSKVQVPVWCSSDQSDIKWYTATKHSDGTYTVKVKLSNHKNHTGTYKIHVYVTASNGIKKFVGNTTQEIEDDEYYTIMGTTSYTVDQMVALYNSTGYTYPSKALKKGGASTIRQFCQLYYDEAAAEGVKAEVAFAQAMHETGWLQFGGDVSVSQFNFAGLGATGNGVSGNSFDTVQLGIRAHIQHLKAYASTEALNQTCVDTRYAYVTKGCAPYVEWLGQKENPNGYGWAAATNYGNYILTIIDQLKEM